ncbi:serine O-acetyltransferase [Halomonas sp. HL-93]|uniref:serine O-acetyltransferase n=1 Tax=Halomonas sp. HL-93 TaxID=1666906 RepID=UPI000942639C
MSLRRSNHIQVEDATWRALREEVIPQAFSDSPGTRKAIRSDLAAAVDRDSSAHGMSTPFLNHKGVHSLQAYRVSHWFWTKGR